MSDDENSEQFSSAEEDSIHLSERSSSPSEKYGNKDRWRASEPPAEIFTEAERHQEWAYEIVGEEVDETGNVMFEVRWDDWARLDGTKSTWNRPATINGDFWKKKQQRLRQRKAKDSLEMDIIPTTDIHQTETYLRSQAYHEKLKSARAMPQPNLMLELARVQAKHQQAAGTSYITSQAQVNGGFLSYPKRNSQRDSTRQKTEISLANSMASTRSSTCSTRNFPSVASSSKTMSSRSSVSNISLSPPRTYPDNERGKGKLTSFENPEKSFTPEARRSLLQKKWSKMAAQQKAAPIYFRNTIDAEPVPDLPSDFVYLESRYQFSPGVSDPSQMEDFLVTCNTSSCFDIADCECQAASTLLDETGSPKLAYTPEGYFAFNVPKGTEVVECNKLCKCTLATCINRVSQRPRDVPMEIFKTQTRGWGVRPLVNVKRGKILGLYTGLVVPRDIARSHPNYMNSDYIFDLDGDENDEDVPLHHPLFSVDSKSFGNWTRFINHSCSPNLQLYLVVRDIPPGNGLPFIAFVANEDISAKTEFSFDYDPRAAERLAAPASKGKKKRTESNLLSGGRPCKCGAATCRGVFS